MNLNDIPIVAFIKRVYGEPKPGITPIVPDPVTPEPISPVSPLPDPIYDPPVVVTPVVEEDGLQELYEEELLLIDFNLFDD